MSMNCRPLDDDDSSHEGSMCLSEREERRLHIGSEVQRVAAHPFYCTLSWQVLSDPTKLAI